MHELQHLHDELDLADAARPELHVACEPFGFLRDVDFRLHRLDLFDRLEVEVSAIDERLHLGEELVTEGDVTADRPRLQHRRALPGLAPGFVIRERALERVHDRTVLALGPEAEVDAEDEAVGGDLAERSRDRFGDARRDGTGIGRAARAARALAVGAAMDVHEIDVGAVVELAAAELAHCEHDEAKRLAVRECAELGERSRSRVTNGDLDRRLGERGELAHRLVDGGTPGEIAGTDPQELAPLEPPE